jgi:hypothetical protein
VTIPGWRALRGLPTGVRAGTPGFPTVGRGGGRRNQMFAGGAGGSAALAQ